jgi:hypothetical protein
MVRYSKQQVPSPETRDEALKVARATQQPGQTKEQTKLIAQGIQKGIAEYKKQQKARARAADRQRKQVARQDDEPATDAPGPVAEHGASPLPWTLLILSWCLFAAYFIFR